MGKKNKTKRNLLIAWIHLLNLKQILSPLAGSVYNKCSTFLSINKNLIQNYPYYSTTTIAKGENDNYFFSFKIGNQIKVLNFDTLNLKEPAVYELDLAKTILDNFNITCIKFPVDKFVSDDQLTIFVGFSNGIIIEWNFVTNHFEKILNFDSVLKASFRSTEVEGFYFPLPRGNIFYVLTSGSVLVEYDTGTAINESSSLYKELSRYDDLFCFEKEERENFCILDMNFSSRGFCHDEFGTCSFYYNRLKQWDDQVFEEKEDSNQQDLLQNTEKKYYKNSLSSEQPGLTQPDNPYGSNKDITNTLSQRITTELTNDKKENIKDLSDDQKQRLDKAHKEKEEILEKQKKLEKEQEKNKDENTYKKDKIRAWWKFNIKRINNMIIFPKSSLEEYTISNMIPDLKQNSDSKILCFIASNDGFLRIIDLVSNRPIFTWEYEGRIGLNSLTMDYKNDLLFIGTQDDSMIVLNLKNMTMIKFDIYLSFVTQIALLDLNYIANGLKIEIASNTIRLVSGCMDGTFFITDINQSEYKFPQEKPEVETKSYKIITKVGKNTVTNNSAYAYVSAKKNPDSTHLIKRNSKNDPNIYFMQVKPTSMTYGAGNVQIIDNLLVMSCYYGDIFVYKFKSCGSSQTPIHNGNLNIECENSKTSIGYRKISYYDNVKSQESEESIKKIPESKKFTFIEKNNTKNLSNFSPDKIDESLLMTKDIVIKEQNI